MRIANVEQQQLRSKTPLSNEQLRTIAPSIFAAEPHESRSARYTYIPTVRVLDALRGEGFEAFQVAQSRTRDVSRREHTRHLVRLRHASVTARGEVGEEIPEIVLINSHDGSSSYQMFAGLFRLVCSNGLVVASSTVEEIRVPHSGDVAGRVIEGAFSVVRQFEKIEEQAASMKALPLTIDEQRAFGTAALVARYGEQDAYPITVDQVIGQRRWDDRNSDLWSTFNRVQENVLRGGLRARRTATGRRSTTRGVTGISENVQLNRALWTLAEQMKQIKLAA